MWVDIGVNLEQAGMFLRAFILQASYCCGIDKNIAENIFFHIAFSNSKKEF